MSCKRCYKNPCCCGSGCHDHEPNTHVHENHGHRHGHPCHKCHHDPCSCHTHGGHGHTCHKCHHNPCSCHGHRRCHVESLPSTIDNFIKHFFGSIVKTCVDGKVVWTLPCDLDTGLENNPRLADEGLACYFRRLFEQGIVGLTGPEGSPGNPGEDGNNAYTVTLSSFVQPTPENPNSQVLTAYNPAIFEGLTVFIQTSGYHFINATDGNGTLFLTLIQAADNAPAVITAGKLVTATGPRGTGTQGQQGVQGSPGDQGTPGESFTATNGFYSTDTGTDFSPAITYSQVNFGTSQAQVTLPAAGKYMLTAVVSLLGKATVTPGDIVEAKLRDVSNSVDVEGSEQGESNLVDIQRTAMTLHALYETDSVNHTIGIFAKCTTAGAIDVVAVRTVLSFVRIA